LRQGNRKSSLLEGRGIVVEDPCTCDTKKGEDEDHDRCAGFARVVLFKEGGCLGCTTDSRRGKIVSSESEEGRAECSGGGSARKTQVFFGGRGGKGAQVENVVGTKGGNGTGYAECESF